MLRRSLIVVALVAAFFSTAHAFEIPAAPLGRLSDFAGVLDAAARQRIEDQLAGYAQGSTFPYAVAIFKSLDGESVEDLSIRIAKAWKIGSKKDGGVLLTVYLAEHKLRIEVGYGLEENLTDAFTARVEREIIAPAFRTGDIAGGLQKGLAAIDQQATGREHGAPLAPRPQPQARSRDEGKLPGLILFAIFIVVLLLSRRGGGGGGGIGSFAGGLLTGMTLGGRGGGGWSGGDGGGGFGGFGGDGGGFGGGGSSGDW